MLHFERHLLLSHHHHLSHWGKEMIEYYLFATLWLMGNYGANLLMPLLLFSRDFSIQDILIFYLVNEIWLIIFGLFAGILLKRFGLKPILIIGALAFAIFLTIMGRYAETIALTTLLLIIPLRSFGKLLLNFGHEVFMIKVATSQKHSTGGSIAWVRICVIIASVLSPAAIAFVAHQFGYGAGFHVSAMLVAISLVALALAPNHHFRIRYRTSNIVDLLNKRLNKRYLLAEAGRLFPDAIIFMIWPVFLYFVVGNIKDVGILTSVSAFLAIAAAHFIGKFVERHKEDTRVFLGSVRLAALLHFGRAAFPIPLVIIFADCIGRVCESAVSVAYETRCYRYLHSLPEEDLIEIAHARIFMLEIIYLIAIGVLFAITSLFETLTPSLFLVIFSFSSICFLFMGNILMVDRPEPLLEGAPRKRWWRFWQRSF